MRYARLKPSSQDTWHHCYNRAVGTAADRPFDDADKEQFVRILMRVAAFYAVRIVAYQVMSASAPTAFGPRLAATPSPQPSALV